MADVILTLGGFQFQRTEVPEHIRVGGKQKLAIHKLVGGNRAIDSLGPDDSDLSWKGLFRGQNAVSRARYLDTLRKQGHVLLLTWGDFSYQVVIEEFRASFRRFYWVPYSINCVVKDDNTAPISKVAPVSADQQVRSDNASAWGLGSLVGDSTLTNALTSLNDAIQSVSNIATAATATLNTILQPIAAAQQRTDTLIASASNTISNVASIGGLVPDNTVNQQAQALEGQVSAFSQSEALYRLRSVLGRMSTNIGSLGNAEHATSKTVAGGSLIDLAQQHYGDATLWPELAKANGLKDPQISGLHTIKLPPHQQLKSQAISSGLQTSALPTPPTLNAQSIQ